MSVPDPDKTDFGNRVRSAVFWRSGSQIVAQLVMWTSTVLVVRLLDPHDYGLFAMTQVVLVLFNFLNGYSFASSLVQAESLDRNRIAQVFGILILLNGTLAILQLIAAPFAAAYFHQPIVASMLRVQALLYLPTPFIALPSALLARGLDFKKQAMANFSGAIAGAAMALTGAMSGWGVWTLVYAPIAAFSVRAFGLTIAARLLVWPSFRFKGAGDLLRFGSALLLAQFFWIIMSQADVVIAGRALSPRDLGLYAEGLFLTQIFTAKFIPPINEIAFPAYAELNKDGDSIAPAFLTAVRLTMFIAFPLYFGIATTAEPLIATVFGPKWVEMAPMTALLALAMPMFTLQIICSPATNALGRPGIYARTSGFGALVMPIAFAFGIAFGVNGLAYAWIAGMALVLGGTLALTLPAISVRPLALLQAMAPSLIAAVAMAMFVTGVDQTLPDQTPSLRLAVLATVGGLTYASLLWMFARPTLSTVMGVVVNRKLAVQLP